MERKPFISPYKIYSIHEGKLGRNSRQNPEGKNWSRDSGGKMLNSLLFQLTFSYLSYPIKTTCPGPALHREWALLHLSLIKKRPQRLVNRTICWKNFLNWDTLSTDSLCQVDQKTWHTTLTESSVLCLGKGATHIGWVFSPQLCNQDRITVLLRGPVPGISRSCQGDI